MKNPRTITLNSFAFVFLLTTLSFCNNGVTPPAGRTTSGGIRSSTSGDRRARDGERDFWEAAAAASGFAGFYYASPGSDTLVVAVANDVDTSEAKNVVSQIFARKRHIPPHQTIVVRHVRFSFLQLDAWRAKVEPSLLELRQVTMVDLDEQNNTLTVGVERIADRSVVDRVMESAGIPREAYRVIAFAGCRRSCSLEEYVTDPPPTGNTLKSYHRPAEAGMRLTFFRHDSLFACTISETAYAQALNFTLA